jgi:hypothetical protein
MNAAPGHYCPQCGHRLSRSTVSSVQADALARMTGAEEDTVEAEQVVQQVVAQPVYSMTPAAPAPLVPPPTVVNYQQVVAPPPPRVQLIEKTSKYWKAQMVWSVLLMLAGMGGCAFSSAMPDAETARPVAWICVAAFVGGLVWYVIARVGAWWDHG